MFEEHLQVVRFLTRGVNKKLKWCESGSLALTQYPPLYEA